MRSSPRCADRGEPDAADYEGDVREDDSRTGLVAFEDIDDISIVAAPGSTAKPSDE